MAKKRKIKLSFKKEPRETGLRSIGRPYQDVNIKVDGKVCGVIYAPTWRTRCWSISLATRKEKTVDDPCEFQWNTIGIQFNKESEAREWVKRNIEQLHSDYQLHFFEDED